MTKHSPLSGQIDSLIDQVVFPMEETGADFISTDAIAVQVVDLIDPQSLSPDLLRFASLMHIKQCVRLRLAKRHDPIKKTQEYIESEEGDLFGDKLQPYYPVKREGERHYARRELLTDIEVKSLSSRMAKAGRSLLDHADALRAWFKSKAA